MNSANAEKPSISSAPVATASGWDPRIRHLVEFVERERGLNFDEDIPVRFGAANAIRRLTRQAAQAAESMPRVPILTERERTENAGVLLITGDRGLAGAFNSNVMRTGTQVRAELEGEGANLRWYAVGRRGVSSLTFRKLEISNSYVGITDRPSYADAREIANDLISDYVDGKVDRVDIVYNSYI